MNSITRSSILWIWSSLVLGSFAHAETEKPDVSISGFFDGYYSFNFNNPPQTSGISSASVAAAGIPPANNTYRYYDTYHNQLTLSLAELTIKAAYKEVSLVTDFDFGPFADLNASTSSSSGVLADESSKHIGQAVISYRPSGSRFSVHAGKMYSHLGVETVKSKDNFNYSRSILFSFAIPFWHTGIRVGFEAIPETLQASLYIYNGWNTQYDINRSKTIGAQLRYTPSERVTVGYNFIGGPERANSESDWKSVHELGATISATNSTSLIGDVVYGFEENASVGGVSKRAKWYGALVGVRQQISEKSYLSPRFEVYRDNDGYTLGGAPQTINSVTLTFGHKLTSGLETRAEARGDFSNESSFAKDTGTSKSQTTLLVAGLFTF